ncbi:hypothetical protein VOLCADRAFT_93436 [Volvox carteri f. nagariensis]|uniref:Uncharacterized protein n=1 Tax=Volvox carteri f. nagariensis TaxID=3068 RepID=D8U245_VOLCA|nr:uncharacterized protein VOLCADRAFT_93436 [Volvox carteri f. nagariensis]EFJ46218.1 hypothetical protein VOLCADRAFT_93436 [Volvox carteri f. nagariensis]|eukprot:XP_002952665.1 hypothetical protein VOLCADRAFT_93436 [Volvox carteri f. nagariensis]
MAWALQPVVNVGLQILLSIFLGWLLVRFRVLDAEKYMPQVNTLVLWVGVTCLAGYYLGIKLQLDDAEAWRTLAAYVLWIVVTKLAILLYCLAVKSPPSPPPALPVRMSVCWNLPEPSRSRRRCKRLGDIDGSTAAASLSSDGGNSVDVKNDGGGDVGSSGFSVLRESALLTLVLTANNTGMIGLPIMDATFGAAGRRLALLTVHKVRQGEAAASKQRQQQRRRSNLSYNAKVEYSDGSDDDQHDGGDGAACCRQPDGMAPPTATAASPIANGHHADGGADATNARVVRRDGGRGAAEATLLHRTAGAAPAPAGAAADAQVRLTPFRRSADAVILSGGRPRRRRRGPAAAAADAARGRFNPNTSGNALAAASASRAVSAPLEWSRGDRDGGIGIGAGGGRMEDRRTTVSVPQGAGSPWELARVWEGLHAPTDLALPGAGLLIGAARAAAVAVAAAAAAASLPPSPSLPFQPRTSPFAAMACVAAGEIATGTGGEGWAAVRSATAKAAVAMHVRRRSGSTGPRAAAAVAAGTTSRKSPAAPLPAALSLASTPSATLYGIDGGAGRRSSSHDGDGGVSQATSYESHTAYDGTTQQPRKSVSGGITAATPEPQLPTAGLSSTSPPKPPLPLPSLPPQSYPHPALPPSPPLRSRRRLSALCEIRITTAAAASTGQRDEPPPATSTPPPLRTERSPPSHRARSSDSASAELLPVSRRGVVVEEYDGEDSARGRDGGRTTAATAAATTAAASIATGPERRPVDASGINLSADDAPMSRRGVVLLDNGDSGSLGSAADGGGGDGGGGAGGRTTATIAAPAAAAPAAAAAVSAAADGVGTGIRQLGTAMRTVGKLGFVPELLHWFASIAVPVSLVSIGVWMYGKRMPASLLRQAGTLLLLKVAVLPLLQAACAVAVGLPAGPTLTLVLLALCPTATISFVIAAYFGYGTDVFLLHCSCRKPWGWESVWCREVNDVTQPPQPQPQRSFSKEAVAA